MTKNRSLLLIIFMAMVTFSGCLDPALHVQYHTLTLPAYKSSKVIKDMPVIILAPIELNSFLGNNVLVRQNTENTSILMEQHRWAGNLKEMLTRMIIQNLRLTTGQQNIYPFLETGNTENCLLLYIKVLHFEENPAGEAFMEADWVLKKDCGDKIIYSTTSRFIIKPEKPGYDGLTAALGRTLTDLSQEITDTIVTLNSNEQTEL